MLQKYEGKRVKLISVNNNIYEGTVGDYCYPEDDESNKEMIVVDTETKNGKSFIDVIGFYETDIKSIEIVS